jgi:hypothetical protein
MRFALLGCVLAACSSSYGPVTSQTDIQLDEDGGFTGPGHGQSVHIVGTAASYESGGRTGGATLATDQVDGIIGALEDVDFLGLAPDFTTCTGAASDAPTATFRASLTAGTNTVHLYLGCNGGTFDELADLRTQIFERSGFTAWVAAR